MEMIKNQKILLTIIEKGVLSGSVSNTSTKEIRSKILTSPYEEHVVDRKGIPTGKYITPKGHFKASNDFKERNLINCSRKTVLSESATNYFISNGSCPHFINSKKWEKMTEKERLEVHLNLNAEGKDFIYELI